MDSSHAGSVVAGHSGSDDEAVVAAVVGADGEVVAAAAVVGADGEGRCA